MDEKRSFQPHSAAAAVSADDRPDNMHISRAAGRTRLGLAFSLLAFIVYMSYFQWMIIQPGAFPSSINDVLPTYHDDLEQQPVSSTQDLVPLEAHIISKCPDTRDAMKQLILPAMQRISDKVDFKLSYIGKTTANDGIECMHGPSECMGNIIELCARELYPDPKASLGFIMCLTRDYQHIPERALIEDCALEHAIDFDALNECATRDDGAHGLELLRHSVERSKELGVTTSCTIRLNDEVYCIRDGGEWHNCPHGAGVNDLVIAIQKLYHRS
jgi:hypothetical protein